MLLFPFCNQKEVRGENTHPETDTVQTGHAATKTPLRITYHIDSLKDKELLAAFKQQYTPEQLHIIGALNRIDTQRIRVGSVVAVPDTFLSSFIEYSPFPEQLDLPDTLQNTEKIILIAKRLQLFAAYENGSMVRFGPVSTGKKSTPTPSRLYYTNFKAKLKISTVNGSWRMPWYFNISNHGGIGLHEYQMPGYPASHSCIRLYKADAIWIYNWAKNWVLTADGQQILQQGTPVIIFGEYDFDAAAPWKAAAKNPDILQITTAEWSELKDRLAAIQP